MKKREVKNIALIAHDNKKAEMVNWAMRNKEILAKYFSFVIRITVRAENLVILQ